MIWLDYLTPPKGIFIFQMSIAVLMVTLLTMSIISNPIRSLYQPYKNLIVWLLSILLAIIAILSSIFYLQLEKITVCILKIYVLIMYWFYVYN